MEINRKSACFSCKWNNNWEDFDRTIFEGRCSHCENGSADLYDDYPNSNFECSGFELSRNVYFEILRDVSETIEREPIINEKSHRGEEVLKRYIKIYGIKNVCCSLVSHRASKPYLEDIYKLFEKLSIISESEYLVDLLKNP